MKKILLIICRNFKTYFKSLLKKNKSTFILKFSSYEEAKASQTNVTDYINESLEKVKSDKFLKPEDIKFENKYNLIPILASTFEKEVSILEFGGGNNPIFSYIKFIDKNKIIYSSIIEKETFIEKFKDKIPDEYKNFIEYFKTVDNVKDKKFDIVYFGSSLQYIVNHEELLFRIFNFKPKYIAIARTFFSLDHEDFYVLQNNIEDNIFPYKMIDLNKFLNLLENNNYKLIYNYEQITDHKHENIENIVCKDFIFKKIQNI